MEWLSPSTRQCSCLYSMNTPYMCIMSFAPRPSKITLPSPSREHVISHKSKHRYAVWREPPYPQTMLAVCATLRTQLPFVGQLDESDASDRELLGVNLLSSDGTSRRKGRLQIDKGGRSTVLLQHIYQDLSLFPSLFESGRR
jgi:hypothetical protein